MSQETKDDMANPTIVSKFMTFEQIQIRFNVSSKRLQQWCCKSWEHVQTCNVISCNLHWSFYVSLDVLAKLTPLEKGITHRLPHVQTNKSWHASRALFLNRSRIVLNRAWLHDWAMIRLRYPCKWVSKVFFLGFETKKHEPSAIQVYLTAVSQTLGQKSLRSMEVETVLPHGFPASFSTKFNNHPIAPRAVWWCWDAPPNGATPRTSRFLSEAWYDQEWSLYSVSSLMTNIQWFNVINLI